MTTPPQHPSERNAPSQITPARNAPPPEKAPPGLPAFGRERSGAQSAGGQSAGAHPAGVQPDGALPSAAPAGVLPSAVPPSAAPAGRPRLLNGSLTLRPRGLWLITSLELRQRLRSARWYIALAVWTIVLLGIGLLGLAPTMYTAQWDELEQAAAFVFSLQIILVLFAMLLVVPALSAGSINGDRSAGTLATLQASLLSPLEIVLGRLIAGFATGLAFLVLALPSVVPIALLGGIGVLYFARIVLVIALLTLCVTAVGLGLSALTNRQLGSVVLAYVIVFGTTVVMPVTWGVSAVFLQQEREVVSHHTTYGADWDEPGRCVRETDTTTVPRIDLSLPLIWGNPVVLLAEAAPPLSTDFWRDVEDNADVLRLIKLGLRSAATITHPATTNFCDPADIGYPTDLAQAPNRPVWPMGFALWLLAAALSLAVAVRRVAVPIKRLGRGTRIA